MELSSKMIVVLVGSIFFYLYLSDLFKSKEFVEKVKRVIAEKYNVTTESKNFTTTHTIINMMENQSNTLAGIIGTSSMYILSELPVNYFQK